MTNEQLSEQEVKDTLKHIVLGFSSAVDEKDLTPKEIAKGIKNFYLTFDCGWKFSPIPLRLVHKVYEKLESNMMSKYGGTVSGQIFLCDLCVFVLKMRLKKLNSLTLPVIKGKLMKKEPDLQNLKSCASDVHSIISYQREKFKGIVEAEESKLKYLKALKGKVKEGLESQFFKKRKALKASLVQKGMKNTDCMLRAYELFTLKTPSKTGKIPKSQGDVANALVEEGLTAKCSQQTISRWNNVVKRELKALAG